MRLGVSIDYITLLRKFSANRKVTADCKGGDLVFFR